MVRISLIIAFLINLNQKNGEVEILLSVCMIGRKNVEVLVGVIAIAFMYLYLLELWSALYGRSQKITLKQLLFAMQEVIGMKLKIWRMAKRVT